MAKIGQILFNYYDKHNKKYLSSLSQGNIATFDDIQSVGTRGIINLAENLIVDSNVWNKLGIQAPKGSIFIINGKSIIIGISGIYEIDNPAIEIYELYYDKEHSPQQMKPINIIIDYVI